MISFLRKLWKDPRGNALVVAGAALPLVIGSAGLASDTIQWTLWKRELQRVADSAAEAGVYGKVAGLTVDNCSGVSTSTYAKPVANEVRKDNHLPQSLTCVAQMPPTSGSYTADANAVKVIVSMQRSLSFSGMFMTAPTITASSTATIIPSGKYCVVSLESQAVTGIDATGSTNVNLGCGMITNSTSLSAAVATGSSSVSATPIAAVGGIPSSTHWGSGTVLQPFTIAQADPFGTVPLPTPSSCTSFPSNSPSSAISIANPTGTKCFSGNVDIKGDITLAAGTYVIDGGSLSMTNTGGSITCTGCTIIMMNSSGGSVGSVDLHGGKLVMTAPSTNCVIGNAGCYDGILFYQSRSATSGNTVKINGNSGSTIQGALYFPTSQLTFNGDSGMHANCMQIVAKDVQFTGSSSITNTCPSDIDYGSFSGKKVRLVE